MQQSTHELDNGNLPINVILDLSKAFDAINNDMLIDTLKCHGIKRIILILD